MGKETKPDWETPRCAYEGRLHGSAAHTRERLPCRGWEGPLCSDPTPRLGSLTSAPAEQGACATEGGEARSANHSASAPSHPRGSAGLAGPRGNVGGPWPRPPEAQVWGPDAPAGDARRPVAGRGRQRHRPGRSERGGASREGGAAGAGPPGRFWKLLEGVAVPLLLLLPPQRVPPPAPASAPAPPRRGRRGPSPVRPRRTRLPLQERGAVRGRVWEESRASGRRAEGLATSTCPFFSASQTGAPRGRRLPHRISGAWWASGHQTPRLL